MAAEFTAVAQDKECIRVTKLTPFSGGVEASGALIVSNWTITGQAPGPTAAVAVESVVEISPSIVDLVLTDSPSFSKLYLLTVKPAASGGITGVVVPDNTAAFIGFIPIQPAERAFSVADFIPQVNKREDDSNDLSAFTAVLDDVLEVLLCLVDRWTDILDLDIATENYLDVMLDDFANPFAFDLSELDKRRLLSVLIEIYKQKGTKEGIRNAIRFFLAKDSEILEVCAQAGNQLGISQLDLDFILGGGTPYDFWVKLDTGGVALTVTETDRVTQIVDLMKPGHTHMTRLLPALAAPTDLVAVDSVGDITLTWTDTPAATSHKLYRRTTTGVTVLNGGGVAGVTSPHIDTPVPAGDSRFYIVVAVDGSGNEGIASNEATATAT